MKTLRTSNQSPLNHRVFILMQRWAEISTVRSVLRQRTTSLRRLASGHKVSDIQSNCKKVKTSEDLDFERPHPFPWKIVTYFFNHLQGNKCSLSNHFATIPALPLSSSSFSLLVEDGRGGREGMASRKLAKMLCFPGKPLILQKYQTNKKNCN